MSAAAVEVSLFGDRRLASVTKNRCNWKVEWRGLPIDSFVPVRMAINARDAAQQAARRLESLSWGNRVLMASLRGAVDEAGTISTEFANWINAKADGRAYDRHEKVSAGLACSVARAALARAAGGQSKRDFDMAMSKQFFE